MKSSHVFWECSSHEVIYLFIICYDHNALIYATVSLWDRRSPSLGDFLVLCIGITSDFFSFSANSYWRFEIFAALVKGERNSSTDCLRIVAGMEPPDDGLHLFSSEVSLLTISIVITVKLKLPGLIHGKNRVVFVTKLLLKVEVPWFMLIVSDYFWCFKCSCFVMSMKARKFYIRRNYKKVDSIETGRMVIAHLFPWSDLEKCMYGTLFQLMMMKFYRHYLIYECKFICLLFWTTFKLPNDRKMM